MIKRRRTDEVVGKVQWPQIDAIRQRKTKKWDLCECLPFLAASSVGALKRSDLSVKSPWQCIVKIIFS